MLITYYTSMQHSTRRLFTVTRQTDRQTDPPLTSLYRSGPTNPATKSLSSVRDIFAGERAGFILCLLVEEASVHSPHAATSTHSNQQQTTRIIHESSISSISSHNIDTGSGCRIRSRYMRVTPLYRMYVLVRRSNIYNTVPILRLSVSKPSARSTYCCIYLIYPLHGRLVKRRS